jgi:2-dehydropantoate 2-reductase
MRITIIGAGVLGQVYGTHLATAGADVSFLVRGSRAAEDRPFRLAQQNGAHRQDTLDHPQRVREIPARTGVVLVAVRADQLTVTEGEDALAPKLRATAAPIVVLTPLLPPPRRSLEAALGRRVVPAMPSVAGWEDEEGLVRYWAPAIASTLIEAPASSDEHELELLARKLTGAGLPARLEREVGALNAATTIAFFPLIAAIAPSGSVDAVLADAELLTTTLEAAHETDKLALSVGKPASWAHVLTRYVGPFTLKAGVALGRRLAPEAVRFVEHHFGPKLLGQHLAMGETILAMASERSMPMPALERLLAIVRAGKRGS